MKDKKIWIVVSAIAVVCVAVCVGLWIGGSKPLEPVGTWRGVYTYDGNEFDTTYILNEDGTYFKETYKNGSFSSSETGTYEATDTSVLLRKDGNKNTGMEFTYEGGKLVNNGHGFAKQ